MSPRRKRAVLDLVITASTFTALFIAGARWWAFLLVPFAVWNYYDGMTRASLPGTDEHKGDMK